MKRRFCIIYEVPLEETLEKELKQMLESRGWEFYGSGYDTETNERDLSFYKETIHDI